MSEVRRHRISQVKRTARAAVTDASVIDFLPPKRTTAVTADPALQQTPLHALHQELGARMVPFAGYEMPVQYPSGVIAEHLHCRSAAAKNAKQ